MVKGVLFSFCRDRDIWKKTVLTAFPPESVDPHKERDFNAWQVGDPLPHWARPALNDPPEREYAHSEEELGDQTRGDALEPSPCSKSTSGACRPAATLDDRRQGRWELIPCPVCRKDFRSCDLPQHQPLCRGPGDANQRCLYCNKLFESVQSRKNHERYTHPHEALRDGLITSIAKRARG